MTSLPIILFLNVHGTKDVISISPGLRSHKMMAAIRNDVLVAENLVTRDVNKYSEDPVMISCGQHSSRFSCNEVCERRAFDLKEESHVNIRSQIAGSNYSYQSTSLLFQGY